MYARQYRAFVPSRPPSLRPSTPRKPWQQYGIDRRQRGRAGVRDREQILREEPICRECERNDHVTASAVVDHIVPLSEGGSDARTNKQGLCVPCHDAKSKAERARAASRRAGR